MVALADPQSFFKAAAKPALEAALTLVLVTMVAACGEPVATPEPVVLRATGSMAMAPLVTELGQAFSERAPNVSFEVTGLGTQLGLDTLSAGEAEIALASWLPPDAPASWQATPIARDGIAVIVHPSNLVDGLGLLQLQDLFGGRIYEWRAVGGPASQGQVQLMSREEGSGVRAAFEALVMGERPVSLLAVLAPSSQAVVDYVAGHPNAIGYVSMSYVTSGVKMLEIEGELPTPETAGQASYALTRELWLVTADPPSWAVQDFIDFVLSPAGQQIVGGRFGRMK